MGISVNLVVNCVFVDHHPGQKRIVSATQSFFARPCLPVIINIRHHQLILPTFKLHINGMIQTIPRGSGSFCLAFNCEMHICLGICLYFVIVVWYSM